MGFGPFSAGCCCTPTAPCSPFGLPETTLHATYVPPSGSSLSLTLTFVNAGVGLASQGFGLAGNPFWISECITPAPLPASPSFDFAKFILTCISGPSWSAYLRNWAASQASPPLTCASRPVHGTDGNYYFNSAAGTQFEVLYPTWTASPVDFYLMDHGSPTTPLAAPYLHITA